MKRLCLILVLVVGCATAPTYQADPALTKRAVYLASKVVHCVSPGDVYYVHLLKTDEVNARVETGRKIFFTEGLLKFPDESVMLVAAHEIAHDKLDHIYKRNALSLGVTATMLVANIFVPGIGLLNHAINPLVSKGFSRSQELDADRFAVEACMRCFGFTKEHSIEILESLGLEGGGLWSTHPSSKDRIENIKRLQNPVVAAPSSY